VVLGTLAVTLLAPVAALAAYGAIAINPRTGSWGAAHGARSRRAAESRAKRRCPGRCHVLLWVRDQCAAAVSTPAAYWAGWGRSRKAAIRSARRRAHALRARLVTWTCSG
jgi:hypothetical protein